MCANCRLFNVLHNAVHYLNKEPLMNTTGFFSPERDQYLKVLKHSLLNRGATVNSEEYADLINEWEESSSILRNDYYHAFSREQRDFNVFNRVSALTKYKLAYLDKFTLGRERALSALGCVILYLDYELSAFRVAGNAELQDELRSKGIRHGSVFKRDVIGVFVANQAKSHPGQVLFRIGEENYLDIFSDYVSFAYYEEEAFRDFWGVNLVLMRKEAFSLVTKSQIDYILETLDLSNIVFYPFVKSRYNLLDSSSYSANDLVMLLDIDCNVVFTSSAFEQEFDRSAGQGPFTHISSFMSELVFVVQHVKDKKMRITRDIFLDSKTMSNQLYVFDMTLVMRNDSCIGAKCSFLHIDQKKAPQSSKLGQKTIYTFDSIKGSDPKLLNVKSLAMQASQTTSNVLIQGESGTGKELIAQSIHCANTKRKGPFVPINCAAITPDLLTSELFGYEDGAFTGASKGGKAGKFEQADGGTILLDEISEMPLNMQSSLLRVLEDGVISRVGGNRYINLNVRVIAATNKDLWSCVQAGKFRSDLYFRLNIVKICIPPLRERQQDIELMMHHFLSEFSAIGLSAVRNFSPDVTRLFISYPWPGNVRELKNTIERCINSCRESTLTVDRLPEDIFTLLSGSSEAVSGEEAVGTGSAPDSLDITGWKEMNADRLADIMKRNKWNKSLAAKEIGIARGTLYKKLREFGISE